LNTLAIIVIIYLALAMTRGFFQGFIKTLFSMMFFILVLVTAAFLTKPVTNVVSGSKNVRQYVEEQSEQFLEQQAEQDTNRGNDGTESGLAIAILGSALQVNGVRTIAAEKITDFMLNVIGYFSALILAAIIWIVIEVILNHLTRNHVIGSVNRFFGLLLGLFRGLIIVWIIFGIIYALQFTGIGGDLESQIQNSALLSLINRGNVIARYLPQFLLSLI
jgi:uncharacterized membrane protein required for colicin V production